MKDLITNKADLAMTSLKITKERNDFVDFSLPFMETVIKKISLIKKKIKQLKFNLRELQLWLAFDLVLFQQLLF